MTTRRGFFGLLAGLAMAPVAARLGREKRYEPLLWEAMQQELAPRSTIIISDAVFISDVWDAPDARGDA